MFKKYYILLICFFCLITFIFGLYNIPSNYNLYFPIKSKYTLTSKYGYRELNGYHFHGGIDLAASINTPVYALSSGTVKHVGFNSSYGNYIIISYYNGFKSIYGHLSSKFSVSVGNTVNNNSIVGTIGSKYLSNGKLNGMTTGPHLHFSLYKDEKCINPLSINFSK